MSNIKKEFLVALGVVLAGGCLGFGLNLGYTWLVVVGIVLAVGTVVFGLRHIFSKAYREGK